jgi:hypothetical protein
MKNPWFIVGSVGLFLFVLCLARVTKSVVSESPFMNTLIGLLFAMCGAMFLMAFLEDKP